MTTCLELYGYEADWDTGFCSHCHKEFTDKERIGAIHGTVRFGWDMYMHQWCFDFTHPVFITPAMAREKWYDTHPELWDGTNQEETLD